MRFLVLSCVAAIGLVGCGSQAPVSQRPVDRFADTEFCRPRAGAETMAEVLRARGSVQDASFLLMERGQASTEECGTLIGEYMVSEGQAQRYADVMRILARHQACMDDLSQCD
jgi:hypothetical protein